MSAIQVDTTRLPLLLHELSLPAIARLWPEFAERADKEGWPAARFLSALCLGEIPHGPPAAPFSNLQFGKHRHDREVEVIKCFAGEQMLFTRTTDIVQKLQAARQALQLEAAISKLDKYHLLILDDVSYVHKDLCRLEAGRQTSRPEQRPIGRVACRRHESWQHSAGKR